MNNDREFPSLITMVGIVAVVVAVVILVFFGIGYLIGRLVL
jgi:preprotein translocase subunit SecE